METNTDKNSLNFVSDYSSVSLIKSSFFHVKVTNTRFRLVRGNYHVPAIWHNQLVHYSAISLQSNISNATLVDTCFMMLDNLLLFFFRHLSSSISSKSFHFFFETPPISYISCKVCGLGFDCIFVVVTKLLVCFIVVIKPHWLVVCQQFSIWCWLSFQGNSDICKLALADKTRKSFSSEQ